MKTRSKKHFNKGVASTIAMICVFFFASVFASLSCFGTKEFKLDRMAYQINNYNQSTILDEDFKSTIVNVKSHENDKNFFDMLRYFYYNSLNRATRVQVSNKVTCNNMDLHLVTQDTYSIRTEEEPGGGYYIDKGLYYSYYSNELLGNRQYLSYRFGCETFVFISDVFADKLIDYYGISSLENAYELLITEKEYAVIDLVIDGNKTVKVCINNIVYSTKRQAPRTLELYGDFALFCYRRDFIGTIDFEFEVDLKDNPYCIKQTIKSIEAFEYNSQNSDFTFKSFDKQTQKYKVDDKLTNRFKSISEKFDWIFYLIFSLMIIAGIALLIILAKFGDGSSAIVLITCSSLFIIYGLLATFIYNYPLFSLSPILFSLTLFIFKGKESKNEIKDYFYRKSHSITKKSVCFFDTIKI